VAPSNGSQDLRAQLDLLGGLCHAFASATTLDEVAGNVGFWVRAAVGTDEAAFRLLVPDAGGRLRTVVSNEDSEAGRKRSARRRAVFHQKKPTFHRLNRPGDAILGFFPLISRGERVGMLEVTASEHAIHTRRETLLAVASQVAIALRNVRDRAVLERQRSPVNGFIELVGDLVAAPTPKRATAIAARLCFEQLQVPVAGWGMTDDRSRLELTSVRGLDPEARRTLKARLRAISPWRRQSRKERDRDITAFAEASGDSAGVTVGDAGDALLMIAGGSPAGQRFVDNVVALLREVLEKMAVTAQAERRNRELNMGIAWTAHELRRPLLALRLLTGSVLEEHPTAGNGHGIRLLQRQLDELVKGVDGMLHWAMGEPPVRSQSFDLVRMVQEVVEASRLEKGHERLRFAGSPAVIVRGDPSQVRHAVENLVANALTYAPDGTEVNLSIEPDEEGVTLIVQDHGPGVPSAYRDAIFDPFVRVAAGRQPRGGQGLGLFIARQIVEGHGGSLWLEPGRSGATFRLRLPRQLSRGERFAS
jgi:signal transduction histidine kinase